MNTMKTAAKKRTVLPGEARLKIGEGAVTMENHNRTRLAAPKINQREWAVLGAAAALTIFW